MAVTDPIADMLTRIRNASQTRQEQVVIPASRLKLELAKVLRAEGYIQKYQYVNEKPQGKLRLTLKYTPDREPIITGLRRISKPGRRMYVGKKEIPRVQGGLGIAVLSTSRGILIDRDARRLGVGGELLCEVW